MYYSEDNRHQGDDERPIDVSDYTVHGNPARNRRRYAPKIIALCLVCALIGGLAGGAGVKLLAGRDGGSTTIYTGSREPIAVNTVSTDTRTLLSLPDIYARYVNSTVGISVDIVSTNIFGQTVTGAAAGSGFVITSDGYIATNYHVIDDANTVTVTFVDGTSYPAVVVGGEEDNDIAVLKIEATGLTPVVLGDSDAMLVGEQVAAIGNPLGELTFTLTSGYVSALNRSITMSDGTMMTMLQTDTAINSGNSGGPLFNMYGEVIGITSAKYSGTSSGTATIEGIGFAIPMDTVKDLMKQIMENGYVTGKPFLGISVRSVDSAAREYGIPYGARVYLVTPGLCSAKAGMQEGDIITAVGDTAVQSSGELIAAKNAYKAGDTVSFTVYRDGKTLKLDITFDEENADNVKLQTDYDSQQNQNQQSQQQDGSNYWPFFNR